MKERFFQYILRIFSAIYNSKVFIFFSFFYYVITIVEVNCRAANCFCNPLAESEKRTSSSGVLVSDKFKTKVQKITSYNTFEALSAEISSSSFSGLFICLYRLQENMQTFFNEFEDLLENIVTTHLDIYILGDFNLHLDVSDSNTQRFNEILICFNLKQHVIFSTHVHGHWLDLLITKSSCDHVILADGISDHFAVVSEITLSAPVRP